MACCAHGSVREYLHVVGVLYWGGGGGVTAHICFFNIGPIYIFFFVDVRLHRERIPRGTSRGHEENIGPHHEPEESWSRIRRVHV